MEQIKAKKSTNILVERVKALRERLPQRFGYAQKVKEYCDSNELGKVSIEQCYQMINGNHTPTPLFIKALNGVVKSYEKEIKNSFK